VGGGQGRIGDLARRGGRGRRGVLGCVRLIGRSVVVGNRNGEVVGLVCVARSWCRRQGRAVGVWAWLGGN
jgi:hypothetical protein